MEGVPRISMTSFPMRRSADTPNFKKKLKHFIRDHYNEDGESYSNEINELESLRAGAIHISKDFAGCSTLKKYFCQLNFLKSRFPLQEGGLCSVSFSWYDVYSETVHGWSDADFEMSCILYNIGALHSELGVADSRQTADGMKNACTHFQCAAWAFQHLRHNYQKFFTPDVSPDTLSIMTNICLAQAQECILEKSLIDNRKSTITAKVALQIFEYYQLVLKTIDQMLKDSSQYSDKLIKAVKKWRKAVELKAHYYDCLSLLYRGMQAEDESRWGERVTFYKAAVERLTEAVKSAKSLEKTDNIHDTLQFTFDVVQGKVAISEKENEFIYHEKVPELSGVASEIKGVSLVKGIPFQFDDPEVAGPDIFGRLVPMEAHEASSLYSEEKAKILRNYSRKIEEKNEAVDRLLIALHLDQLDLYPLASKVPQELVDCCAALSVKKDAVKKLSELMSQLSGMYHDVDGNLKEIQDLLKEDEVKEKEYQEIAGKRVPSNLISELSREVHKYQNAHTVAAETNQTLHETLSKHVANLNILMKPFDEVLNHLPSLKGEVDEEPRNQMKKVIKKIDEMRDQRAMLEQQLRDSIHADDITKQLVIKKDEDLETVFQEQLQKHNKITQILDQNLVAQENIMRALTEANAKYAETRKATVVLMKKRVKAIEELLISYETYDELLAKCNTGIEFYTKLDTNIGKLLHRVRGVCEVQEKERAAGLKKLMKKVEVPSVSMINPGNEGLGGYMPSDMPIPPTTLSKGPPKLKDYLEMRKGGHQILPDATQIIDTNYIPAQSNVNPSQQSYQQYPLPTEPYQSNNLNITGCSQPVSQYNQNENTYINPANNQSNIPSVRPAPVGMEDFSKNSTIYSSSYGSYSQQQNVGNRKDTLDQRQYLAQPPSHSSGQCNTNYVNHPTEAAVTNPINQNQYGQNYTQSAPQYQYYAADASQPSYPQSSQLESHPMNVSGKNCAIGSQQQNAYFQPPQQSQAMSNAPLNFPKPQEPPPNQAYTSPYGPGTTQTSSAPYSVPGYNPNPTQETDYINHSFLAKYVKQNQGYTLPGGSSMSGSYASSQQSGTYYQPQQSNFTSTQSPYGYGQQAQPNDQQHQNYGQNAGQPAINPNQTIGPQAYGGYNQFSNVTQAQQTFDPNIPSAAVTNQGQYPQNQQYTPNQPGLPSGHYTYPGQQQPSQGQGYL